MKNRIIRIDTVLPLKRLQQCDPVNRAQGFRQWKFWSYFCRWILGSLLTNDFICLNFPSYIMGITTLFLWSILININKELCLKGQFALLLISKEMRCGQKTTRISYFPPKSECKGSNGWARAMLPEYSMRSMSNIRTLDFCLFSFLFWGNWRFYLSTVIFFNFYCKVVLIL